MENIFITDTDYEQLASSTQELLEEIEHIPYPKPKEQIQNLLQSFDMLHREALTRLFREIIINYPDLHSKMQNDKSIHLLFSLYDLFQTDLHHQLHMPEENGHPEKYPMWMPVGNIQQLKDNTTYKYSTEGENILVCKTEGKVYAVKNCCGNTVLPLDGAAIEKGYLICPWHGCLYRLSDGCMETNAMLRLKKYPVEISTGGEIRIGLNM